MKLLNLFLAVVAATETTVASVETTAAATVAASTAAAVTVAASTAADVVETTAAATVAESTVADVETTASDVVETTASDVEDDNIEDQEDGEDDQEDDEDDPDDDDEKTDCAEVKAVIVRAKQGLEEQKLAEISEDPEIGGNGTDVWKWLENFCTEVCVAEGKNCDGIFKTACTESQSALKAASNETEKTAMKTACDLACADVEGETCGFFANGLSFVLFAILAVFKY